MIRKYMRDKGKDVVKVSVVAPVRVMDIGGWTDTWFAHHGQVLCLSVLSRDANNGRDYDYHGIVAEATVSLTSGPGVFKLHAPDVGKELECFNGKGNWDKTDLIEATLSNIRQLSGLDIEVIVRSPVVPKGSSVGSSATVAVALTALLDYFNRGEVDSNWVSRKCHEVETKEMGIECGVQDQAAAASPYGVNFIDVYHYPNYSVQNVVLTDSLKQEIEARILTIIYGGCHSSSDIHKMVIAKLQEDGRLALGLEQIRRIPEEARYCLLSEDYAGLGRAMRANTAAQYQLHPELISPECQKLIDFSQANSTLGEKVNGAGGPQGGSLTVLCGDIPKETLAHKIVEQFPDVLVLEHKIADQGLKVRVE